MTATTISVPDIGGHQDVDVIEVCVKEGDSVSEGDSLIVLETDKASMEVPAEASGVVRKLQVKEGDTVNEGDTIGELEVEGASAAETGAEDSAAEEADDAATRNPAAESTAASGAASQPEPVRVPDIGGHQDVDVIEVCVQAGDTVAEGDSLIVLETDKASMEVPAPRAGQVTEVKVSEGDQVNEGDLVLELSVQGGSAPETPADKPAAAETPPPAAETAGSGGLETLVVPDIGGHEGVDVIEVCVAKGDEVAEGDSLIVLETDKASMEVPATHSGQVKTLKVKEGDSVSEGDAILDLAVAGGAAPSASAAETSAAETSATKTGASETPAAGSGSPKAASGGSQPGAAPTGAALEALEKSNRKIHAGPAVRALAREFGVDLAQVTGTGPRERILKEDVQNYVKTRLAAAEPTAVTAASPAAGSGIPAIPEVDFAQFGPVRLEKMSKIHRMTAQNMTRCWLNVPHVTQFDDVDISELEAFRKEIKADAEKAGVKVTPLPFLLKAAAAALRAHPKFNVSLHADGEHLVHKDYVHLGIAMDTPVGLMVPVIRDVDQKSIFDLAAEAAELGAKAQARKLKPAEMQGACFTISSLGGIGGTGFTPIVPAPEVAILGVSRADIKPVWDGSQFVPRKMLPLALSYDHRAINGADAGRFLTHLGGLLKDVRRLLL